MQDVELTAVRSAGHSGTTSAAGGTGNYDTDVTATRKGDLAKNCPDESPSARAT